MSFVVGVDGGGTKTHAVVADEAGTVLGFASNGASNWESVGSQGAALALRTAVDGALAAAGTDAADVAASAFGLAGMDWESDRARLEAIIEPLGLGGPRVLVNDAIVALRAGTSRPWGVAVVAGTGTVVAGRSPAGELFRTLGLGQMYGDWGSASDVSEEAVRAVADEYTGRGPATTLTDAMCRRFGSTSAADLLESISRSHLGVDDLAPLVVEAARAGDGSALEIVQRAGEALGASAALVARRLGMQDDAFEVVLAGGLFRGSSSILETALEAEVRRAAHRAVLVRLGAPPVVGAVLMALELAETPLLPGVRGDLSATVSRALRMMPSTAAHRSSPASPQ